jgi:hypothetical protein
MRTIAQIVGVVLITLGVVLLVAVWEVNGLDRPEFHPDEKKQELMLLVLALVRCLGIGSSTLGGLCLVVPWVNAFVFRRQRSNPGIGGGTLEAVAELPAAKTDE